MQEMTGKGKKNSISYFWISICVRNIVTCVKNFCIKYERCTLDGQLLKSPPRNHQKTKNSTIIKFYNYP